MNDTAQSEKWGTLFQMCQLGVNELPYEKIQSHQNAFHLRLYCFV
jgi:hypothetical protein